MSEKSHSPVVSQQTCGECNSGLVSEGADFSGICPKCLMSGLFSVDGRGEEESDIVQRIEGYELLELIGKGGQGEVYRARQVALGRDVAIKLLTMEMDAVPGSFEQFRHEANTSASLNHPNIVKVHDYGISDSGEPFLVMELEKGDNLDGYIEKNGDLAGHVSLFKWIFQICSALSYAHRHKTVHRDIKPSNILITESGDVKITDFGLAEQAGHARGEAKSGGEVMVGTAVFSAPEQMRGERKVDERSDIYSLGAVLHYILTAEAPRNPPVSASRLNRRVDSRFDSLISEAMAALPEKRVGSVREFSSVVEVIESRKRERMITGGVIMALLFAAGLMVGSNKSYFAEIPGVSAKSTITGFAGEKTKEGAAPLERSPRIARFRRQSIVDMKLVPSTGKVAVVLAEGDVVFQPLKSRLSNQSPSLTEGNTFDQYLVVAPAAAELALWNTEREEKLQSFEAPRAHTSAVALTPDRSRLIRFRREEKSRWIYELDSSVPIRETINHKTAVTIHDAFFLNSRDYYVICNGAGPRFLKRVRGKQGIDLCHIEQDEAVKTIALREKGYQVADISEDRALLAAAGYGESIVLVDFGEITNPEVCLEIKSGFKDIGCLKFIRGSRGRYLIAAPLQSPRYRILDTDTGNLVQEGFIEHLTEIAAVDSILSDGQIFFGGTDSSEMGSAVILEPLSFLRNEAEF